MPLMTLSPYDCSAGSALSHLELWDLVVDAERVDKQFVGDDPKWWMQLARRVGAEDAAGLFSPDLKSSLGPAAIANELNT